MTTNMERLIEEANQLQHVAAKLNEKILWTLPEIYVVGAQSSGKSSVLDRILGRQILPRGDGMMTKTPIRLELTPLPKGSREYVELGHKSGIKFNDFSKVTDEIIKQMNELVHCGVSSTPVLVKFYSPNVLKLTLVDMPGLIRVPDSANHQLPDQITELVRTNIRKPNSLIVALTVADDDPENSPGYAEAKLADPDGSRTLAVITKVDRAQSLEKTKRILLGKETIRPKLGIVGVINKFKEANENMPLDEKNEAELTYFQQNFEPDLDGKYGINFLTVKLQEVLYKSIKEKLPFILPKLYPKIESYRNKLISLGEEIDPNTIPEKDNLLTELVKKYSDKIVEMMEAEPQNIPVVESVGGAKIKYILFNDFPLALKQGAVGALEDLNGKDLDMMIITSEDRPSVFTKDKVLNKYINQLIDGVMQPCKISLNQVHREIGNILGKFKSDYVQEDGFNRYPNLVDSLIQETEILTDELVKKTVVQVDMHIAREKALKNYSHPDFDFYIKYYEKKMNLSTTKCRDTLSDDRNSPISLNAQQKDGSGFETGLGLFLDIDKTFVNDSNINQSDVNHEILDSHHNRHFRKEDRNHAAAAILGYSEVVAKSIADIVPKIIYHQLLDALKGKLFLHLHSSLKLKIDENKLFHENESVSQQRKEIKAALKVFESMEQFLRQNRFSS